jgi:hypothetical protein
MCICGGPRWFLDDVILNMIVAANLHKFLRLAYRELYDLVATGVSLYSPGAMIPSSALTG